MQLEQIDLDGTVVPGDTIDVCPAIYYDGDMRGLLFMRVRVPVLSDGSSVYSWTAEEGWTKLTEGNGYVVYGFNSVLESEATSNVLTNGMTMVEMSGSEYKTINDINVTVDGWLAYCQEYGDSADINIWNRIVNGQ